MLAADNRLRIEVSLLPDPCRKVLASLCPAVVRRSEIFIFDLVFSFRRM